MHMRASIHHIQVAIPVDGETKAREFYGTVLGLEEIAKPPNLSRRGGVWFQTDNLPVHLGVDHAFHPAEKAHVAFQVVGLTSLVQRLAAAGYVTTEDESLPGFARCYVSDPFGNRTELLEPC